MPDSSPTRSEEAKKKAKRKRSLLLEEMASKKPKRALFSSRTQKPMNAADSASSKLSHRLLSALGSRGEHDKNHPSSAKKEMRRTSPYTGIPYTRKTSPLSMDDTDEEDPIYRGSIAHKVLEKLMELDPDRLEDDYSVEREDEQETASVQEAAAGTGDGELQPTKPRKKEPSSIRYALEMPEVIFRPRVLPQHRHFREGDRVAVRQGDVQVGTGFVIDIVAESRYLVQSTDGLGMWTVHSSQINHLEGTENDLDFGRDSVRLPQESFGKTIREEFLKCLDSEFAEVTTQRPQDPASSPTQLDYIMLARLAATEELDGLVNAMMGPG